MTTSVSIHTEIPFHDVDSLSIAWHGHYYKYFELARTALYRCKGFDIDAMQNLGYIFPVIESHCRYVQPLKYGQEIMVSANFKAWQHYIHIAYTISDAQTQQRCAYGHTKQAACDADNGEMLLEIPGRVMDIISV